MRKTKQIAVILVVAALVGTSAVLLWVTFFSPPMLEGQIAPLRPWFLQEGAEARWDVYEYGFGEWQNYSAELKILAVGAEEITLVETARGPSFNRTVQIQDLFEHQTTLGAGLGAIHPLRIDILDYEAGLGVVTKIEGEPRAMLSERAVSILGLNLIVTSRQVVELPNFLLLESESTVVLEQGGSSSVWSYQIRNLVSVDGVDLLSPRTVTTYTPPPPGEQHTFYLFNGRQLSGEQRNSTLHLNVDSETDAVLAAIMPHDAAASLRNVGPDLEDLLWPLNETHSLFAVRLSPGLLRLDFERFNPPEMVGNTLIVTIPKRVAEAMGWNEGDEVKVQIAGRDVLHLSKSG